MRVSCRVFSGVLVIVLATAPEGASQTATRLQEPLPVEVVASMRGHNGRSSLDLSPDGEWVVHTIRAMDRVPRDSVSRFHSATGFSFGEGDARMEATLTHTRTGEVITLGGPGAASWAAVWSPDGSRVAFYSDEGGAAGLWIWDRATRTSRRVPGITVRPFFGFEAPRWVNDEQVLIKVLPDGMTIAEANVRGWPRRGSTPSPEADPDAPSVTVRHSTAAAPPRPDSTPSRPEPENSGENPVVLRILADLALIDVTTQSVTRLVTQRAVRYYRASPDGRYVAFSVFAGGEPNTQQSLFDLAIHDRRTGETQNLGAGIRLAYGIEWSWSPDGGRLAYFETGQRGAGGLVVLSIPEGDTLTTSAEDVPSFDPGDGELSPIWSDDGRHVYGVADGAVWRVDTQSGQGAEVAAIPGWRVRALIGDASRSTMWTTNSGRTAWVVARAGSGAESGLYAVDLGTGQARGVHTETKNYLGVFNLDVSERSGEIAFVSSGQEHPSEIFMLSTRTSEVRRASQINADLHRHTLGRARVIAWRTDDGDSVGGSLLLPVGYQPGQRVPLVVWVYGGSYGSRSVNRFGLTGNGVFNMQILATRGYAVLFPDAPVREGQPMADLARTVLPGVDAAIAQGYADPDRLAIMGQSYGSYSVLALITQTTRFKAAVITAAVLHPDLVADYLRSPGYYEQGQGNMGGTPWEYPDRYRENSPLFLFERIETPVLIGQGERDGNLVPAEAIFTALERLDKSVEYRLYDGEGHVITRAPNVIDFWERRLEFLAEHLGLRVDDAGKIVGVRQGGTGTPR